MTNLRLSTIADARGTKREYTLGVKHDNLRRLLNDLHPTPYYLLSKRTTRCTHGPHNVQYGPCMFVTDNVNAVITQAAAALCVAAGRGYVVAPTPDNSQHFTASIDLSRVSSPPSAGGAALPTTGSPSSGNGATLALPGGDASTYLL
eukprot:1179906-Prorocentrum_minimum.AAC.2